MYTFCSSYFLRKTTNSLKRSFCCLWNSFIEIEALSLTVSSSSYSRDFLCSSSSRAHIFACDSLNVCMIDLISLLLMITMVLWSCCTSVSPMLSGALYSMRASVPGSDYMMTIDSCVGRRGNVKRYLKGNNGVKRIGRSV